MFRSKRKKEVDSLQLCIDGDDIEKVCCTKFLGVLVDEHISWTHQIKQVESKISKSIDILYRAKSMLGITELYTVIGFV